MAKRSAPEVNAGSMADIAFLLLIFFLVTTTIETNQGIPTKLPAKQEDNPPPPDVRKRNIFVVLVDANDQLLVEDELMDVKDLRQAAIDFLDNGASGCDYCQGFRLEESSVNPKKAIISLRNNRGTTYEMYVRVRNELTAAYNTLRERERKRLYPNEVTYMEMDAEYNAAKTSDERKEALKPKITALQDLYPMALSEAEPKTN